jgi:serine-type D-Ala-D-Ala carboxypeptidase (penicillin-binding protein 5/6)
VTGCVSSVAFAFGSLATYSIGMMIRVLIGLLCLYLATLAHAQQQPTAVEAVPTFETAAPQAILIDGRTGEVFFEKSADVAVPPASMSKLMTQSIVFDLLKSGELKDDQEFSVSEDAWRRGGSPSGSSTMYAELNSKVRIIDLLRGAIVQSANDACIILAEGIAGSELAFTEKMRKKAEALGLKNSVFKNATGLPDEGHVMSMRDLALLAKYIIYEHPERYRLYSEKSFTWNKIEQANRNPLLKDYAGADGMKTGFTKEAGYGLVGSVERDGRRLIMAVAGLNTAADRKTESQKLLDWGFRQFKTVDVFEKDEVLAEARVWGGDKNWVDLRTAQAFQVALTPAERKTVEMKLTYNGPLYAPVKAGTTVGQARVVVAGRTIAEIPVVTAGDVSSVDSMLEKALDSLSIMVFGG